MSTYALIRGVYRWGDRVLLQRFPASWKTRAHAVLFKLARRLFPQRITARSPGEFAASPANRQAANGRLPEWARAEVASLVAIEPLLAPLVADGAPVQHYVIPWDMQYVGHRYALARRQLHGPYACFLLLGGATTTITAADLAAAGQPLAIIDVDGTTGVAQLAQAAGADYIALPAEDLDVNDHCAVLARLVLQLAPRELRHAPHPLLDQCMQRHGLALASVSAITRWNTLMPSSPPSRS